MRFITGIQTAGLSRFVSCKFCMVRPDVVRFAFHHFSYRRTYHAGVFGLSRPVQTTLSTGYSRGSFSRVIAIDRRIA